MSSVRLEMTELLFTTIDKLTNSILIKALMQVSSTYPLATLLWGCDRQKCIHRILELGDLKLQYPQQNLLNFLNSSRGSTRKTSFKCRVVLHLLNMKEFISLQNYLPMNITTNEAAATLIAEMKILLQSYLEHEYKKFFELQDEELEYSSGETSSTFDDLHLPRNNQRF